MTRIVLPTVPAPARVIGPHPLDFGGSMGGGLGGALQRVNRLGTRWRYAAEFAPMEADLAREWAVDLNRALRDGVTMRIRQPGLVIGNPGAPKVNGAGQTGTTLQADGFSAGYAVRKGQFFAIIASGQRYLHQAAVGASASAGGVLAISIEPRLRLSPADNADIEFANVSIDGLLEDVPDHGYDPDQLARGFSIKIVETR